MMTLPVRRFNPAPGISIDVTENVVIITGECEVWGPAADADVARRMTESINRAWTRHLPYGYDIQTTVAVYYRSDSDTENTGRLQIYFGSTWTGSNAHKGNGWKTARIKLNNKDNNAISQVLPHEFGHTLGLADRYDEAYWSKISSALGGPRGETPAHKEYENEMMGGMKRVQRKTIDNLRAETEPSASWISDDDEVRDWLKAHSNADIAALTPQIKLTVLRVLMSGWISDADVDAMVLVTKNVTSPSEAKLLRGGIDPMEMKGVGQRTRFRIALDAMPK
jgi:hypothetical protein